MRPASAEPVVAPPSAPPRPAGRGDRWRAWCLRRRGVAIGRGVTIGRDVRVQLDGGGRVTIGDGCALGAGTRLEVSGGSVELGPGAVLGERCVVACHERVAIGPRARLADQVVVVDFDHRFDDSEMPVRLQGLRTAPVVVGTGARIGPGAALLRGVTVGERATVGAHAVVTTDVPPLGAVTGIPAS